MCVEEPRYLRHSAQGEVIRMSAYPTDIIIVAVVIIIIIFVRVCVLFGVVLRYELLLL